MNRGRIAIAALALAATAVSCTPAPATQPGGKYRVPATFAESLLSAVADIYGSPAGANHWNCKPSAQHPRPVILVHGFLANMADNLSGLSPMLANEGYCVFAMNYGGDPRSMFGGFDDIRDSSLGTFGPFVNKVLAATGASQVDVIGHSEGSVMPRYWMRFGDSINTGGTPKIANMIGIAAISQGVLSADLALKVRTEEPFKSLTAALSKNGCPSCTQMMNGSDYITAINTTAVLPGQNFSGPAQPGVQYLMLATTWDNLVIPYTAGFSDHPQFTNTTLQDGCPIDHADHLSIIFDPRAYDIVLNTLDPAHQREVRCVATRPVFYAREQPRVGA